MNYELFDDKPLVLTTSIPFVLIGPHPGDPLHPDIPLVKSAQGATELLGYVHYHGPRQRKGRKSSIELVRAEAPLPYWNSAAHDYDSGRFVFVWRGVSTNRDKRAVAEVLDDSLPDIVKAVYRDGRNAAGTEWAISQVIFKAEMSTNQPSLLAVFHPANRSQLYIGLSLIAFILLSALGLSK